MRNPKIARPVLTALVAALPLMGCGGDEPGKRFTLTGEEKQVRGMVVNTELTLCGTVADKPGTCEGTMVVEPQGAGEAGRIALEVTRDVALKKEGQTVFLPQLQGSEVAATYRASEEGPQVATSVVAAAAR